MPLCGRQNEPNPIEISTQTHHTEGMVEGILALETSTGRIQKRGAFSQKTVRQISPFGNEELARF